jgi:hypothetical protein
LPAVTASDGEAVASDQDGRRLRWQRIDAGMASCWAWTCLPLLIGIARMAEDRRMLSVVEGQAAVVHRREMGAGEDLRSGVFR